MDYKVLVYDTTTSKNQHGELLSEPLLALQQVVEEHVGRSGWKLQGGISISTYIKDGKVAHTYAQALTKTDEMEGLA